MVLKLGDTGGLVSVFTRRSLPAFVALTRSIYPQIDDLALQGRTALVSLVYNRGARLNDENATLQERREMRNIRDLLAGLVVHHVRAAR